MLSETQRKDLFAGAKQIRAHSYSPYSKYAVGAALLTKSGNIYLGTNIENAAYPAGICAERVAVFKAVADGERDFAAIVVVTRDGGTPCGSCRQVLAEFSPDALVIVANEAGEITREAPLHELLPGAFGPKNLNVQP
jgi:cytidine deaminase